MEKHGLKIHNLYGASECGAVSWDDSGAVRGDGRDLGVLLPGVRAGCDAAGRLIVSSSSTGLGYDEMLPGENYGGGVFATCDQIEVREGRLFFERSLGGGINVAGRKLSPAEIAEKIMRATDLTKVAIRGAASRDPERCQDVVAELDVPQKDICAEFKARACALLAPGEVPRKWIGRSS